MKINDSHVKYNSKRRKVDIDEIIANKEKEKIREKVRDWTLIVVLMSTLLAVTINVLASMNNLQSFFKTFEGIDPRKVQLFVNIFNIVVSLIFLILFSNLHSNISDSSIKVINQPKYKEITDYKDELDLKIIENPERVRNLEKQYLLFIIFFTISLCLTYAIIILHKTFVETNNPERSTHWLVFLANVFNISGGLFIYLAFRVLHDKTLGSDHRSWTIFWLRPVLSFLSYVILLLSAYLVFSTFPWFPDQPKNSFDPHQVTIFLNISDLFAGLITGICMTLLFGRYVSIEQSVKNTKMFNIEKNTFLKKFSLRRLMSIVIILALPFYAISQLLFGSLTIEAFGGRIYLQNGVYISCLIGKLCFFWVTYVLIKKNLMNLYLHGVVAQIGDYNTLEKCLDSERTKVEKTRLQENLLQKNFTGNIDTLVETSWWEDRFGIFANDPAHKRAMNIGRKYRLSQEITHEENN